MKRHALSCSSGIDILSSGPRYGKHFNYRRVGISVLNGGSYFQKEEGGWMDYAKPELLCIQNPREPSTRPALLWPAVPSPNLQQLAQTRPLIAQSWTRPALPIKCRL